CLGPCVRSLSLTTTCQFEEQLYFFFLVLESSQAGCQQFLQLLLAVLLLDVVFGWLLVGSRQVRGLQDVKATSYCRGDSLGTAGDEPLHQDHEEAEVLAILMYRLIIAQADVLCD